MKVLARVHGDTQHSIPEEHGNCHSHLFVHHPVLAWCPCGLQIGTWTRLLWMLVMGLVGGP